MNFAKAPAGQPTLLSLRRRAHPVPRVRPRAPRPSLRRHLSADRRHQRRPAISSSSRASSTSTGWSSPRCCASSPSTPRPANRCPTRSSTRCWPPAGSTRVLRPSSTPPRRWSTSTSTSLEAGEDLDVLAHEKAVLDRMGMPEVMVMRHRSPHFQHIFSGRLRRRLLQLPLVRSPRRRRLRGLRGNRHLFRYPLLEAPTYDACCGSRKIGFA